MKFDKELFKEDLITFFQATAIILLIFSVIGYVLSLMIIVTVMFKGKQAVGEIGLTDLHFINTYFVLYSSILLLELIRRFTNRYLK